MILENCYEKGNVFRNLRAAVLFYKKRRTVEKNAKTPSYKYLYVRHVLQSKPIRPYVFRLTHGFIEKARGYFDQMIADIP